MAATGTLTFMHPRNYGFLRPTDGSADVYVAGHSFSDAGITTPVVGRMYRYTVETGIRPGQLQAKIIDRIDDESTEAAAVKQQQIEEAWRERQRVKPKAITPTSVEY